MFIYKITNNTNSKVYIGKTVNYRSRWTRHKYLLNRGSHFNSHLQAAWNKYGENSFTFEIVEQLNPELNFDLNNLERYWIKFYESTNPEKGYNKTIGGDGAESPSAETKKRMSVAKIGKRLSEDHKIKIRDSSKKAINDGQFSKGYQAWNKGLKETRTEVLQKIRSSRAKLSRQIKCKESGIVYTSVSEASRQLNICRANIRSQIIGKYKKIKGLSFEYI